MRSAPVQNPGPNIHRIEGIGTLATQTKAQKVEQEEAREKLRAILSPGDRVYTILRNVSRSGMRREISTVIIENGQARDISWLTARAIDSRIGANNGIVWDGAGMDMGFDVVYNLSMALFCPEKYDHDAAYSLKQEWL